MSGHNSQGVFMRRAIGVGWLCAFALCVDAPGQAQAPAQGQAPQFIISGTSTVRSWSCPAQGLIKVTPAAASQAVPGFPRGVQTVVITVPIRSIACEEAEMGTHMREALNAAAYPEIVYRLDQYTLNGDDAAVWTSGKLTVMGVTKPVSFDVKMVPAPEGLRAIGDTTLDMTQFNVKPPDLWNGLLRVGKNVRIRFEAVLSAQ